MKRPLNPFEQWMVKSNLDRIRAEGLQPSEVAAQLRANGYPRIAEAVETEAAAPTFSDLCDLASAHSIRVQPSSRAGCFDLYWPAKPGDDKHEPHAFAVSVRDAIETIRFNVEQDRAARD